MKTIVSDGVRRKTAVQLNAESRERQRQLDVAHSDRMSNLRDALAMARRHAAPVQPQRSNRFAQPLARASAITKAARISTLRAAIAGDREQLDYLRLHASWFSVSRANPGRSATYVPTDQEIRTAARYALEVYGEPIEASRPAGRVVRFPTAREIYAARNGSLEESGR
jgi:hypothetical protein